MYDNNKKLAFISYKAEPITGSLTPDSDGYYFMRSGKIGTKSRAGVYYEASEQVRNLFSPTSRFVERIKDGEIFGEASHPQQNGMSNMAYKQRLATIEPDKTAFFVKEVKLIRGSLGEYEIWLRLKPTGKYGDAFREALEDEFMNVSLSLRGFSKTVSGVRTLIYIVTFDWVHSPGIEKSSKRAILDEPKRNWTKESEEVQEFDVTDDVIDLLADADFALEHQASPVKCFGDICKIIQDDFTLENRELIEMPKSKFSWYD